MFQPIEPHEALAVAQFLDANTRVLRWLVSFFRHRQSMPAEAAPYWAFWRETEGEIRTVIAHSFHTGASYIAAAEGFSPEAAENLLREELLPERITGDRPAVDALLAGARLDGSISRLEPIQVLALEPPGGGAAGEEAPAGFRAAVSRDISVLKRYEIAYGLEMEEDLESDFESLIASKMIYVIEAEGGLQATMRTNLGDGRYVHIGGLYVPPQFRGRGLGVRMVRGLARKVHIEDRAAALLDVVESNQAALNVYRRAGFQPAGKAQTVFFDEGCWNR